MRISVVMAVFNGGRWLAGTLESILAQSETDYELIVVNDGSTDETSSVLETYARRDPRLVVIEQENVGLTRALIRGCAAAQAPYLARHDCGDRSHPDRLRRQASLLDAGATLVSCGTRCVAPEGEFLYTSTAIGEEVRRSLLSDPATRLRSIPHHGSAMFSRSSYESVGGYRPEFYYAQDIDLWMRLARVGPMAIAPEVLYEATIDPRAISSLNRQTQVALTRIAAAVRDGGPPASLLAEAASIGHRGRLTRRGEAAGVYFIAKCLRRQGNPKWRQYLRRALRLDPMHLRAWASLVSWHQ